MATWLIERTDQAGTYYKGTSAKGIDWTNWRPHAAFGDRLTMRGIAQWLRLQGFRVRLK